MKANELRIGNYVYLKSKNKWYEIANGHDIDEGTDSGDFEPIPLTEEWLLKFRFIDYRTLPNKITKKAYFDIKIGFYKKAWNIELKQSKLRIYHFHNFWHVISPANGSIGIEYVHQLQNLYFALTGEELEII